ncbi:tripartite tricarboxylate transporter TctB family protein [Sporosarcina psychrophila]|uniref:tripartite tricarboxylate transporter TctB family protein n=1 Tax=Sporosarcina psychrophila TaxID=1476 RepID=UPI00078E853B|nr:tripartite tricarboxylate transporter TctB family protein [Sporosarcina psychrophila]AMQ07722.1 hypothetical protein AZE41_18235 [Sporosarcina psychrophila]
MKNIFSIFLLAISCIYFAMALNFPMFSKGIPGSGFLPQLIGIILIILTGYDLIKSYKSNKEDKAITTNFKEMIYLILIITAYIYLFSIIGALLSTVLFMVIVLLLFNKGKLKQNLLIGILVPVIIFVMFEVLLNTGLPAGIFENLF